MENELKSSSNKDEFLKHFKSVRRVMVYCQVTGLFFQVKKKDIERAIMAENEIRYYMADDLFLNKSMVMVIV